MTWHGFSRGAPTMVVGHFEGHFSSRWVGGVLAETVFLCGNCLPCIGSWLLFETDHYESDAFSFMINIRPTRRKGR